MSNDQEQDPYEILDLPRSASLAQIKAAYRKLALKYHPDRQKDEESRKRCSEAFTKIGNAYEILGDPERRAEYDRFGTTGEGLGQQQQQQQHQSPFMSGGFFGGHDPFMNDPFFSGHHQRHHQQHQQAHQQHFSNPFDLFRSVFGHDLGDMGGSSGFDDGFGNMNSNNHPFGGMMNHMNMMNGMMNNMHSQSHSSGGNRGFSSFSSSSSTFGGGGGVSESVSTSTRIINGKRQTITERTIVKPDGTVERTTETSGDDDFPQHIENGQSNGHNGHYLQDSSANQQQRMRGFFGSQR